jgi:hypothetical protein
MAEIAAAEFSYRTQNGPGRAGDREIFQEYFSPLSGSTQVGNDDYTNTPRSRRRTIGQLYSPAQAYARPVSRMDARGVFPSSLK